MADYTENYNLKKPARTDFYSVLDFNGNADTIDTMLKTISDAANSGKFPTLAPNSVNFDGANKYNFVMCADGSSGTSPYGNNYTQFRLINLYVVTTTNSDSILQIAINSSDNANIYTRQSYIGSGSVFAWRTWIKVNDLANVQGTLGISKGGTGATTVSGALSNLGINSALLKTYDFNEINFDNKYDENYIMGANGSGGTTPFETSNSTFCLINLCSQDNCDRIALQIAISTMPYDQSVYRRSRTQYYWGGWDRLNELVVPVSKGGTGATTASQALTNLGISRGFPLEKSSTTVFNNDGSITETFLDNSYKTTQFLANGNIRETFYNSLGETQNTKQTNFNVDGSITVTIT